jgi:hypothetical protein
MSAVPGDRRNALTARRQPLDFLGDGRVRKWLLLSFLLGLVLISPDHFLSSSTDDHRMHHFFWYLRELGMALLVAVPILLTIERFNQIRHDEKEHVVLREQAMALVRGDLPEAIWDVLDARLLKAPFYRREYIVTYTLSRGQYGVPGVMEVVIDQSFQIHRMNRSREAFEFRPTMTIPRERSERTRFLFLKAGSNSWGEAELERMTTDHSGRRCLSGLTPLAVPDHSPLHVQMSMRTVKSSETPFDSFATSIPAESFKIYVSVPDGFNVHVDSHGGRKLAGPLKDEKTGATYWMTEGALLEGQGVFIHWSRSGVTDA